MSLSVWKWARSASFGGVEIDDCHQFLSQYQPSLAHRPLGGPVVQAAEVVVDDVMTFHYGELVAVVKEPIGVLPQIFTTALSDMCKVPSVPMCHVGGLEVNDEVFADVKGSYLCLEGG